MFSGFKKIVPESVKNIYHTTQALTGALFFLFPSKKLKIVGVTGTDGKTTTVHLIHHILGEAGKKVSMISTVEAKIGDKPLATGLHVTTPSPFQIQALLSKMAKSGSEYAVIETTSHGLAQGRVDFVDFSIGVITNITHEHLDYHHDFESYLRAKLKILYGVNYRVLNADDPEFEKLNDKGSGQLQSFSVKNKADYTAKQIKEENKALVFNIVFREKRKEVRETVRSKLFGYYNVYNILAAFAVCHSIGVEPKKIAQAVATFENVPGRMQFIDEGQGFDCVVDFAHTPASLESALKALSRVKKGKIIAVFGGAGERYKEKRPRMGKVATQLADFSIFTAEDPRNEDVNKIIDQISQGAVSVGGIPDRTFWKIPDRTEAIGTAIQTLAKDGDTVAIFGKGHEKSMNIKGVEYPWSDEQIVRDSIKTKLRK